MTTTRIYRLHLLNGGSSNMFYDARKDSKGVFCYWGLTATKNIQYDLEHKNSSYPDNYYTYKEE